MLRLVFCRLRSYVHSNKVHAAMAPLTVTSSPDCHCGASKLPGVEDVCDYECTGDSSTACGGVGTMSIYMYDNYVNP